MSKYNVADYNVIYIYAIHDDAHKGLLKVGKASLKSSLSIAQLPANCPTLKQAAHNRILQQTNTARVNYELLHVELAVRTITMMDGSRQIQSFMDNDVHDVLYNSGYAALKFVESGRPSEWFEIDLATAKAAIEATINGESKIATAHAVIEKPIVPVIKLRDEQKECVEKTIEMFSRYNEMLWDCKMRFGKTVTAYELIKRMGYKKVIVVTHRPAVEDGWGSDHKIMFAGTDHEFIDKTNGSYSFEDSIDAENDYNLKQLVKNDKSFVYFASIQDLRGSQRVGGKYNKNNAVFDMDWDLLIIDEAHEGTTTDLGDAVIKTLRKEKTKILSLSGTPYNIMGEYEENKYTWTYVDEQKKKTEWDSKHPGERNPYEELPQMNIFTFDLSEQISNSYRYVTEDSAFNFREFFRTWTGDIERDYYKIPEGQKVGDFVHADDVYQFLSLIAEENGESNYPFSTDEYRDMFAHTFWMVPGVKEAKALSAMLQKHPRFTDFEIVNIAGDGDEERPYNEALSLVKSSIKSHEKTITISCGKLTTGVTVREWTAILMLSGSSSTAAAGYMQAIFRVQSPGYLNGKQKKNCYVFDFAPDRTLKVIAEVHALSHKRTKGDDKARQALGEFINFCPVISIEGTKMRTYDVSEMMRQIKRISVDAAINSGFDDDTIYRSDAGIVMDKYDADILRRLSDVVVPQKKGKKNNEVVIADNGLTEEQRKKAERAQHKPVRERTKEEQEALDLLKKQREEQKKMFNLLRAVSIRLPLLFYGADADITEIIHLKDFVRIVDEESWQEFMPSGLKQELFLDILKYYDEDVVVGAGLRIRKLAKAADELPPTLRAKRIVEIMSKFKNPDKETVLTPWRVVNMHMGDTLGGYNFFDEQNHNELEEPRLVEKGDVTAEIFLNPEAKVLEVNSKSGLYPLYLAYSFYMLNISKAEKDLALEEAQKIWFDTLDKHIFILCKTKMARMITTRTLAGYSGRKVNAIYLTKLVEERMKDIGRLSNKLTNPVTWNKEGAKMRFDAVVGNPPYQLTKNGNNEQIHFVMLETAFNITSQYVSMIQPLNWLNNGKLLKIVVDHVESLYRYSDSKRVFSTVQIPSGVGYTLIDKRRTFEGTNVYENNKVYFCKLTGNYNADDLRISKEVKFTRSIYDRLSTYVGHSNEDKSLPLNPNGEIKIWYKKENGKAGKSSWYSVDRKAIPEGEIIDQWKVMISNDGHAEATDSKPQGIFNNSAIALPPKYITTNRPVLLIAKDKEEAEFIARYANTKFFRRLLHIEAKSNSIAKTSYKLVPDICEFADYYDGKEDLDSFLNRFFNLSDDTVEDINKRISPKDPQTIEE